MKKKETYKEDWFALMSKVGGAITVSASRRGAENDRKTYCYGDKSYKIIPCTITYSLPAKSLKK